MNIILILLAEKIYTPLLFIPILVLIIIAILLIILEKDDK